MRKAQGIIGLPLIAVHEAEDLGKVKEILIDPNERRVKYFLIMDKEWYLGAKVLEFGDILSLGDDAITIGSREELSDFTEVEGADLLAEKEIEVIGSKIFTEHGTYIGIIKEYYIDKEGKISGYMLEGESKPYMIEPSNIKSFGRSTLVVEESTDKGITQDAVVSSPGKRYAENTNRELSSSSKLFEEKQRQFLIGRVAQKRILDTEGNLLLDKGQALTKEILNKVKDKNKIIELTISTK